MVWLLKFNMNTKLSKKVTQLRETSCLNWSCSVYTNVTRANTWLLGTRIKTVEHIIIYMNDENYAEQKKNDENYN